MFANNGCKIEDMAARLESHEKICEFRDVSCPSIVCKKKMPFKILAEHCWGNHNHQHDFWVWPSLKETKGVLSLIGESFDGSSVLNRQT